MKENGIEEGLSTIKYEVKAVIKERLFTRIIVSYDKSRYSSFYVPLKSSLNKTTTKTTTTTTTTLTDTTTTTTTITAKQKLLKPKT